MENIKRSIIKGEAPESDSENEDSNINIINNKIVNKKDIGSARGVVIEGEAPESDDEITTFTNIPCSLMSASEIYTTETPPSTPSKSINQSMSFNLILHSKLYESNLSLWTHLNDMVNVNVTRASKDLLAAEKSLLLSHIELYSASAAMKKSNNTTVDVLDKFRYILTANFLPRIECEQV